MKVQEILSSEKFIEIVESKDLHDKVIVIDFYASWCNPCIKLGDYLNKLVIKSENLVFFKINVDNEKCSHVIDKFDISSIPRILMIKNSTVIEDITGFNIEKLNNIINKYK